MYVYEHDTTLPQLPLPTLKETCVNLKKMMKPLLSEDLWEESCKLIDAFEVNDGKILQEKLICWKETLGKNYSWLRPLWDDMYLSNRSSLPIHVNYSFQLAKERWGEQPLGNFISGLVQMVQKLSIGDLPPEKSKTGYYSMEALQHMFYTRIPSEEKDVLQYIPLHSPLTAAVVCNGHWYMLELTDNMGCPYTPIELEKAIHKIYQEAEIKTTANMSSYTTTSRDQASVVRKELLHQPQNRLSLAKLENALFTLSFDPPIEKDQFVHSLVGGNSNNRWSDKSLQIIYAKNGNIGITLEHAGCDASMWIYLLNLIDEMIQTEEISCNGTETPSYYLLDWNISDKLQNQLDKYEKDFTTFNQNLSLCQKQLKVASKEAIKNIKCRPDAFVQILFQLAYYQLNHKMCSVYEAVSTRSYYQGRTDCVRACSSESADFVISFIENKGTKEELQEKFRKAEKVHGEQISQSQKGLGSERHMLGLQYMWQSSSEDPLPNIYTSKGYQMLRTDDISSSSVVSPCIDYFGYAPVVDHGIGLGYGLHQDFLSVAVSTYTHDNYEAEIFVATLEELAPKLIELFLPSENTLSR